MSGCEDYPSTDETCDTDSEQSAFSGLPVGDEPNNDAPCVKINVPDGTYTQVTVQGGCIVGASQTITPVQPSPLCCGESGTSAGGGQVLTAPQDGANLSSIVNSNLVTRVHFSPASNITVTGTGTASNPFTMSVSATSGSVASGTSTPSALEVTGAGTSSSPLRVNHKRIPGNAIDSNGFKTDEFGHVISYNPTQSTGQTLEPVVVENGLTTLEKINPQPAVIATGAQTMTVDEYGRVTNVTNVIQQLPSGNFETVDGKRVTFQYGVITDVTNI